MTNKDAADYRYLQDAEFHAIIEGLAQHAADIMDNGGQLQRRDLVRVARQAVLLFVAATGQQHSRFTYQPITTPCADHRDFRV